MENSASQSQSPSQDRSLTPNFTALRLTTAGCRNVGVAVTPPAFEEKTGGATLWFELHGGPLAISLTRGEARQILAWLSDVIDNDVPHPTDPRVAQEAP